MKEIPNVNPRLRDLCWEFSFTMHGNIQILHKKRTIIIDISNKR
jgi:hypothetical protein